MHDLSIVIPLDFSRRSKELYLRAIYLAKTLTPTGLKLIYACNSSPAIWLNRLKKSLRATTGVYILSSPNSQNHLSKLRNHALSQVTTPYVLFLDVDIVTNVEQIRQVFYAVQRSPVQLCMYPCLYLTAQGTRLLSKHPIAAFKQYYYQFKREWILHLAFPSSIIICDSDAVKKIQGFDENYVGHGYEDFDFMLRLFKYKRLIQYQQQLCVDLPYRAPLMAVGFRALLSQAQLEQLLQPVYFLHAFHSKDQQEHYYQQRQHNQIFFQHKFQALIECSTQDIDSELWLLTQFFQLLQRQQQDSCDFAVLWAELPGHLFRKKTVFLK